MNLINKSNKEKILAFLKKKGKMTSLEVGHELGITAMGARQHLINMERDGLIQSQFVRRNKGRPALYFHITEKAESYFPQEYDILTLRLLDSIVEAVGEEGLQKILLIRRKKLKEEYLSIQKMEGLEKKLNELVNIRSQKGYMPELIEYEDIYKVFEHNCPIQSVVSHYPAFGKEEEILFEELLKKKVEWKEIVTQDKKLHVFLIHKNNTHK